MEYLLAATVLTGVLLSALAVARKVSQVMVVDKTLENHGATRCYVVSGEVFFASPDRFLSESSFREVIENVRIDVGGAHFGDLSSVAALDRAILKFRREGVGIERIGVDQAGRTLVDRLGAADKTDVAKLLGFRHAGRTRLQRHHRCRGRQAPARSRGPAPHLGRFARSRISACGVKKKCCSFLKKGLTDLSVYLH